MLAPAAVEDLDRLMATLTLPADTRARVRRSLRPLERFPLLGPSCPTPGSPNGSSSAPGSWLVIVYEVVSPDLVMVVAIHDVRSSSAWPGG